MNHIEYECWIDYASGTLDEEKRIQYDNHLYTCESCLKLYLMAVEEVEAEMPALSDPSGFTDSIMKQIDPPSKERPAPQSRNRQTFIHYAVAAAMTLLFMSTGIFSQLTSTVRTFEATADKEEGSIITGLLNKTDSITERIEVNFREGNQHE